MKSTESKPRGRPPGRKNKSLLKNSNASENENSKNILEYFSPPRSDIATQDERKRGVSTPRRRKNPLANLQSNLSPKYIGFSTPTSTEKRKTRYRITKLKDSDGSSSYFRSSRGLIGCVRQTTISGRLRSPLSSPEMSRRNTSFESPIEKLLLKNGARKSLPSSPVGDVQMFDHDEVIDKDKSDRLQNMQKNCVVRIEHMNRNEFDCNGIDGPNKDDVEADFSENFKSIESGELKNVADEVKLIEDITIPRPIERESEAEDSTELEKSALTDDIMNQETLLETIEVVKTSELSENLDDVNSIGDDISDRVSSNKVDSPTTGGTENTNKVAGHSQNEQLLHLQESKFSNDDLPSIQSPSTFSVDSAKGSSLDNDMNWVSIETGDLFWGQIFQFSYWPCMVCPDPEGKTISVNESRGQMQHVMIHVRFFADNGRRSWVKRDNLMSYTGLEGYVKKMSEAEQRYGKKNPKYKVFIVSKLKTRLWNQAVREADIIDSISIEERLEKFFQLVEEVKVFNNIERKRRQSLYLHSSTSDISSMFDSNDNLYLKQTISKRDRSPTPVSPAYSPLGPKNSEKRIKLNERNTSRSSILAMDESEIGLRNEYTADTDLERMQTEDIYGDIEFKKFTSAMRTFIMGNSSDPNIETQFMMNLRSMWAIKHITFRNRFESSLVKNTPNGVKRLSQRIRNISILKSLPSTPIQHREQLLSGKTTALKPKRSIVRPIEEVIEDIFQLDSKYLFRGVSKDAVCKKCLKPGPDLVKCSKNCHGFVHLACSANYSNESLRLETDAILPTFLHITGDLDESSLTRATEMQEDAPPIVCIECISGEPSKCFVCKSNDRDLGELARCNSQHCGKTFHPKCLRYWPQAKLTKSAGKLESLRCPAHVCHTCVSDDPKGKFLQIDKSKLTKCIKCPATYHMDSTCIPAGSQFLSTTLIICPRHSKHQEPFINVNWCFICVSGGKLVCCETCPTAVHAECLKIPLADEGYICEECETGRMPLYGEMVWAKFNNFRWWPSLILPPPEVPENLARKAHNPSEFVIRFFGTNDHAWISRRRVYLYQEGDCSEPPRNQKKGLDHNYIKGVEEAKRIADIIKEKKILIRANDKKLRISPLPYVKIKSNRAVPPLKLQVHQEKISKCECNKDSENPCGQDSGCLNRVLFTECNPKICPAGDRCQNQLFEKKVYPKLDVAYMNEKGFGLICLEPISAGTFVIEYVGEVIDDAEFRRRISQKEQELDENFYFLTLEKDYIIDAGPKGNLARFMNHSCDPNCETQKWSVNGLNRIGLFAIKDIPKNFELTFNYFWDELLGNEKKSCHCGATKCAGLIGGKYKEPAKQSEVKEVKTKSKRRYMTKSKLKSPNGIRKLKGKQAARKGVKRTKLKTLAIDSEHISSTDTTSLQDQTLVPEASTSIVKFNSEVTDSTTQNGSTSLAE